MNDLDSTFSTAPKPVREMLVLIVAAAQLPTPTQISFQGAGVGDLGRSILALRFRSIAEGQAWSRYLGGRTTTRPSATGGHVWLDEGVIRWHGWSVQLHAYDDMPLHWGSDVASVLGVA